MAKFLSTFLLIVLFVANTHSQVTSNILFTDDFSTTSLSTSRWPVTDDFVDAGDFLEGTGRRSTANIESQTIRLKPEENILFFKETRDNQTYGTTCSVQISSNGGATYDDLISYPLSDITTSWTTRSIDLSAYNNLEVKIRFRLQVESRFIKGWYLDDIQVLGSNVEAAQDFTVKKLTSVFVELGWGLNRSNQPVIVAYSTTETNGLPENGIEYGPTTNSTLPDGSVVIYKGLLSEFKHEGLSKDMPYYYRIWSYSGTGVDTEYSLSRDLTARTLSESTIYYEDFESGQNGWTLEGPDEGNSWVVGQAECYRGASSAYVSNNNGNSASYNNNTGRYTDIDLYKRIDIPSGYKSVELSFFWKGVAEPGYDGGGVREGRWTNLISQKSLAGQDTWVEEVIDITDYIGDSRFDLNFNWYNDPYAGQNPSFCIDDIRITGSTVARVSSFSGTPLSQQEVQLNWIKNTDNEDVIIAYSPYGIIGRPVNGVDYSTRLGEYLEGGGQVIYAGPANEYKHEGNFSGELTYKIWAVSDLFNYSSAITEKVRIPVMLPYNEDFEDDVSEWNFNSGYNNAWVRGKAVAYAGNHGDQAAYISKDMGITAGYDPASSTDTYMEVDVDLRGFESAQMTFYWQCNGDYYDSYGQVYLGNNRLRSISSRDYYYGKTSWQQETISLSNYVGSIQKIRFRWNNENAGSDPGFCIDDIHITGTIANPVSFTASNPHDILNDLAWAKNAFGDDIMVAWSEDGVFDDPDESSHYAAGDVLTGGGNIIYVGDALSYQHKPLKYGTTYHYKVWSVRNGIYSSGLEASATTPPKAYALQEYWENSATYSNWSSPGGSGNNNWLVGGTGTFKEGQRSAYVRENASTSVAYDGSSASEAWLQVSVDLSQMQKATLSFDWKCVGEFWSGSEVDYGEVYINDGSGSGDRHLSDPREFWDSNGWQNKEIDLNEFIGKTVDVKFFWKNDGSVANNPGFCIDNIEIGGIYTATSTISLGAEAEPTMISSLVDDESEALQVMDVTFNDLVSLYNDGTRIQQLMFSQGVNNTITNWKDAIAGAKLFGPDCTSGIAGTVNSAGIIFTGTDMITINNLASETYQLKVWLKTDLGQVQEGDAFDFALKTNDIVTGLGDDFVVGQQVSSGEVSIDVEATQLVFYQQPSSYATVGYALHQPPMVAAVDINGNIDRHFNVPVALANTGGINMNPGGVMPINVLAVNGIADYSGLNFLSGGTVTLSASAGSFVSEPSQSIVIQNYCIPNHASAPVMYINNVIFNTINNTTGDDGGYGMYLDKQTSLTKEVTYNVTLGVVNGSGATVYAYAWLDLDGNESFDATERYPIGSTNYTSDVINGSVKVPASALNGITRMRIQLVELNPPASACQNVAGESEDYLIEITDNAWQGRSTVWDSRDNWSSGSVPDLSSNVYIPENPYYGKVFPFITSVGVVVSNLEIDQNASLTINPGKDLTVTGEFTNNGTLLIKSIDLFTGSFIDKGTMSGSGVGRVEATLPSRRYWYLSHPLSGASSAIYNAANQAEVRMAYYNRGWQWVVDNNTAIDPMQGVSVMFKDPTTIIYEGSLNTGNQSIAVKPGYNLISNPYPSSIDWSANAGWDRTTLGETFYVRTTIMSGERGLATYNLAADPGAQSLNGGTAEIPPLQSFWVHSSGNGTVGLNNDARLHKAVKLKSGSIINNVLRMQLKYDKVWDESVIYFSPDALLGLEQKDSEKKFAEVEVLPELYSVLENVKYAINGLPELTTEMSIPLGVSVIKNKEVELSFVGLEDFFPDVDVVLEDLDKKVVVDMRTVESYKFMAQDGDNVRLLLHIKPVATSVDESNMNSRLVYACHKDGQLMVSENMLSDVSNGALKLELISLSGDKLLEKTYYASGIHNIPVSLPSGTYLVRLSTNDGQIEMVKVMIQ